jgi:mono/diheme cytochrome c family protein
MFTRNCLVVYHLGRVCLALLVTFVVNQAHAGNSQGNLGVHLKPALGQTPDLHIDSIISPDGLALPDGSGSAAEGKTLYMSACASCHGMSGMQPGNEVAGGEGSIGTDSPFKTVGSYWPYATTLYDYIARAMPYDKQKSLTADETYAITAYVLKLNQIIKEDDVMDKHTLPKVVMPNADGFNELN